MYLNIEVHFTFEGNQYYYRLRYLYCNCSFVGWIWTRSVLPPLCKTHIFVHNFWTKAHRMMILGSKFCWVLFCWFFCLSIDLSISQSAQALAVIFCSVCLTVRHPVRPSVFLSMYLSVCLSIHPSVLPSVGLLSGLFICPFISLADHHSDCPSIHPSVWSSSRSITCSHRWL